jgi:hypothetical protein
MLNTSLGVNINLILKGKMQVTEKKLRGDQI